MTPTGLPAAAPALASPHTVPVPATPPATSRPSRLRGLSYLRSSIHGHHHSHSPAAPTVVTATNASTTAPTQATGSRTTIAPPIAATPLRRASPDDTRATPAASQTSPASNVWVPTQSGFNGLTRVANQTPAEVSTSSVIVSNGQPTSAGTNALTNTSHPTTFAVVRPRTDSTQVRSIDEALGPPPAGVSGPPIRAPTNTQRPPNATGEFQSSIRFTPFIDARSARESLTFSPVERTLKRGDEVIRVGRYSERDQNGANAYNSNNTAAPVGFKSKVVSRRHCEFWCDNGQWYVKDVKSSSGTFLNHIRLSSPGIESRAYPIHDGDIVQLGIDFKGGEEPIFRCVKIRVELNRAWQKGLNNFNMSAHKRLRSMAGKSSAKGDTGSLHTSECSICLMSVAPCQALFVAPCSHVWHFKCIRPLIDKAYPNFLCPNCRAIADLGRDIDEDDVFQIMKDYAEDNSQQDTSEDEDDEGQEQGGDGESRVETGTALGDANTEVAPRNESDLGVGEASAHEATTLSRANGYSTLIRGSSRGEENSSSPERNPAYDSDYDEGPRRQGSGGPMTPMNDAGPFVLDGAGSLPALSRRSST